MTPETTWTRLLEERWAALPNGRPRAFCEFPAGLAAVSLRLHGGPKCRPPISRMGNKAGFAHGGTGGWKVVPATRPNTEANLTPDGLAARFEGMAREVAAGLTVHRLTIPQAQARGAGPSDFNGGKAQSAEGCAADVARLASGWPPVRITTRIPTAAEVADALGTPGDLSGVVVYMDPPYQGTTGYAANLTRSEVVAHARRFARLGATVAISEATPITLGPGWKVVRLTEERKGQKRTFSKQKEEWLTVYPGRFA